MRRAMTAICLAGTLAMAPQASALPFCSAMKALVRASTEVPAFRSVQRRHITPAGFGGCAIKSYPKSEQEPLHYICSVPANGGTVLRQAEATKAAVERCFPGQNTYETSADAGLPHQRNFIIKPPTDLGASNDTMIWVYPVLPSRRAKAAVRIEIRAPDFGD